MANVGSTLCTYARLDAPLALWFSILSRSPNGAISLMALG
jgi:hypothetical protein